MPGIHSSHPQHVPVPVQPPILKGTREQQDDDPLLTVHEVARHLRVDDTTVRRWIKAGILEAITLPHRGARQAYRVRQSTLSSLLSIPGDGGGGGGKGTSHVI